jgi:trk system potassium uptake protein TrkH
MQVLGLILLAPLALAFYDNREGSVLSTLERPEVVGFVVAVIACEAIGFLLVRWFRKGHVLQGVKEGYAIVAIGWVWLTLWSCLPLWFYLYAHSEGTAGNLLLSFTDAYFEIMSGYTTTGATILSDIEIVPRSILLLRSI